MQEALPLSHLALSLLAGSLTTLSPCVFPMLPLVLVAYASRSGIASSRGWVVAHIDRVKKGFGLLILLLGVSILSGADRWLEARIVSVMPDAWVQLTTGL